MESKKDTNGYRFDDRRHYDKDSPSGCEERRCHIRREGDRFKVLLKKIFDRHMEESITDEQIKIVLAPVLEKLKA